MGIMATYLAVILDFVVSVPYPLPLRVYTSIDVSAKPTPSTSEA